MNSQESTAARTSYDLAKEDPELLVKYLDKYAKVVMIKNCTFTGFVHSIDPVTHCIILSIPEKENYIITIIPGHAVLDVTEVELPDGLVPPERNHKDLENEEYVARRKAKLMSWFKANQLPVTESDEDIIIGDAIVLSPFNVVDVCTSNPMVAMEITKLIENMPADPIPLS